MDGTGCQGDREFFRKMAFLHKLIEFLAVTQGQIPAEITDLGHFIKQFDGTGFAGGHLSQISTDHLGRLQATNIQISSLLGCGHIVSSVEQISGFCQVCGRFCCSIYKGCLEVCQITGITVCRRHYAIKDGVVVSSIAQKGLWRLKARKIAKRRELSYANSRLPTR